MSRERRIRVIIHTRSNPCAAVEKPDPPHGTRLEAVGAFEVTVSMKPNRTEREVLRLYSFTDHNINHNNVSKEEFYTTLEKLWNIVDNECELVEEWSRSFSPCPTLSERQYLCPKEAVEKIKSLGVVNSAS